MIEFIESADERERICREILTALPDWFGIPSAVDEYAEHCREYPVWAWEEEGETLGFIAMKATSGYTAEVYVMGVKPEHHREGIGRRLFDALRSHAESRGFEFIQVKTVKEGVYRDYDLTNRFYRSLGFRELECFDSLWDEQNPCQIYVMAVGRDDS